MILQRQIVDDSGMGYSNNVLCAQCKCDDVRTDPADFDSLPGRIFTDGDAARPNTEPLQP
jgi:hypothetical protein